MSSPAIRLSKVLLPQPLGPTKAQNVPAATSRLRSIQTANMVSPPLIDFRHLLSVSPSTEMHSSSNDWISYITPIYEATTLTGGETAG